MNPLYYYYYYYYYCSCYFALGVSKGAVRRLIKLADFCGRGLVAPKNWLIKLVNYDTLLIFRLLLHTILVSTTAECRSQSDICITFFCI